ANAVEKLLRRRVHAASKHEILPDHDSHLVAQLVKLVRFVNAASPNAQHVHVAVVHGLEQETVFIVGDARRKTVGRNPGSTLRKHGNAVDDEHETLSGLVALLSKFESSNAGARRFFVSDLAVDETARAEGVEWLSAQSVGPPQRRMSDEE